MFFSALHCKFFLFSAARTERGFHAQTLDDPADRARDAFGNSGPGTADLGLGTGDWGLGTGSPESRRAGV